MALEDILDAIRSEAEEESSRMLTDASARADAILADAREVASVREDELTHSVDGRIANERRRTASLAVLEASRARRAAREEVFALAIEKVSDVLRGLHTDPRYDAVLERLFDEAAAALPDPGAVVVHVRDRGRIEKILQDRGLDIPIQVTEDQWGGVVIHSDGRVVRNDLETRLRKAEPHLRFIAGELVPSLRGGSA